MFAFILFCLFLLALVVVGFALHPFAGLVAIAIAIWLGKQPWWDAVE